MIGACGRGADELDGLAGKQCFIDPVTERTIKASASVRASAGTGRPGIACTSPKRLKSSRA
jgi:hypothetical protein